MSVSSRTLHSLIARADPSEACATNSQEWRLHRLEWVSPDGFDAVFAFPPSEPPASRHLG